MVTSPRWGIRAPGRHQLRYIIMPRYALEWIIVILLLLWLFGAFISPFGGNLIHLLLVVLLVVVVIRFLTGRRVVD